MNEWAWFALWVAAGTPFTVVCTAQMLRQENTWLGIWPGLFYAILGGPFALLLIKYEREGQQQ